MQDEIAKKQQFLFTQIIQAGYQPQQFQQFMLKDNTLGDDLSKWKMSQLKSLVKQFKIEQNKKAKYESQKQIIQSTSNDNKNQIQINQESNEREKSLTLAQIFYKQKETQQNYTNNIKCDEVMKSTFFQWPFIQIKIVKCDKRQGGLFQKSYIDYTIELPKLGIIVERRYSDFAWLKQTLQLLHPGMPIPPVSKKGHLRRYDDKHLKKRIYILEMFLNKAISIPQIKADPLFERFLTMKDKKEFQSYKNQFKKMEPVQINKIRNLKGNVELNITKQFIDFNILSKNHFAALQPDIKRMYKEFKGAASSLQSCSTLLNSISENCKQLQAKDKAYRKQTNLPIFNTNFYTILQQITQKYSQFLLEQAKIFRKQIYSVLKYESLSMLNLNESYQKLAALRIQYIDQKNALNKKKQKLYSQGNMNKWGVSPVPNQKPCKQDAYALMLPKQTNQLLNLRDSYALLNFELAQQAKRHMKQTNWDMSKYFKTISKLELNLFTNFQKTWSQLLQSCLQMSDGKLNNSSQQQNLGNKSVQINVQQVKCS